MVFINDPEYMIFLGSSSWEIRKKSNKYFNIKGSFQRRVELWGEGFSYHDHIRWDEPLDHSNSGAARVLYQDGFFQERPSVNDEWIWKIPQAEINANPHIGEGDQN